MDLERFVTAQDQGGTYAAALSELRAGRKQTHWMWFVFPQLDGLGHSAMAQRYALHGLDEARAYWDHPVLGARLTDCCAALGENDDRSAQEIFGSVDAMKLQSSLTLFAWAVPDEAIFGSLLEQYFAGQLDEASAARLRDR